MSDREAFRAWFRQAYPAHVEACTKILQYGDELLAAHGKLALVSQADRERLWSRHLKESIPPPLLKRLPEGADVLDVGSGNGIPGAILAVMRPDLRMVLLEPRRRKVGFLERTVLRLGLQNVRVEEKTLEEMSLEGSSKRWGHAISRGLRWTPRLAESLRVLATEKAVLYRYGPSRGESGDIPLGERVIQCIPRSRWETDLIAP